MPAAALPVAGLVLSGIGLYQQSQAQKAQNKAIKNAEKAGQYTKAAQARQFQLAEDYNPREEDTRAIGEASKNAAATLSQQLKRLNSDFALSGGQPTGDTAFNVSATNTANRVMDPLKMFQAQLASTETSRKMAAYNPVMNAPVGQIANSYFTSAQMNQPNYGPSLQMFTDSLKKLIPGQATPANAIGGGVGGDIGSQMGNGWDWLSNTSWKGGA